MSLDAFLKHPQTFSIWITVCWASLKNILISSKRNTFVSLLDFVLLHINVELFYCHGFALCLRSNLTLRSLKRILEINIDQKLKCKFCPSS